MSTSPTSEATVLLWGTHWWLPGRAEPLEFQTVEHAAEILAANLPEGTRALRLVFQGAGLRCVAVSCPAGGRSTLQLALGFEYPALADERHAWGYEPILPQGDGHGTILHYEEEPALFAVVSELERRHLRVKSAWPLATYLHGLPKEWPEQGGLTVLALDGTQAMAYHHPSNGRREIKSWQGERATGEAIAWIQKERAALPDPVLVVTAGTESYSMGPSGESITFGEALAEPVVLPRAHPAQLLPAQSTFSPQRMAVAASLLLFMSGCWFTGKYAWDYRGWMNWNRAVLQEKQQLVAEIEHARINQREMNALRAQLAGPGATPPVAELLERLGEGLPMTVALQAVRIEQNRFTAKGHVAAEGAAAFAQWKTKLSDSRWKVESAPAADASGAFTVAGSFLP